MTGIQTINAESPVNIITVTPLGYSFVEGGLNNGCNCSLIDSGMLESVWYDHVLRNDNNDLEK